MEMHESQGDPPSLRPCPQRTAFLAICKTFGGWGFPMGNSTYCDGIREDHREYNGQRLLFLIGWETNKERLSQICTQLVKAWSGTRRADLLGPNSMPFQRVPVTIVQNCAAIPPYPQVHVLRLEFPGVKCCLKILSGKTQKQSIHKF